MDSINVLLDKKQGGVYWLESHLSATDLEKAAKRANFAYFQIVGQNLKKKEQFLNHIALVMHFPEYFGDNWDAFEDCLTDLSWLTAHDYCICYDHIETLAEHAPEHFDMVLEIFKQSVDFWRGQGKTMIVLLQGKYKIEGLKRIG